MRHIDLETWPRRDHFQLFSDFDYPHFSLCANVDLTTFYPALKGRGVSFTVALVYVLSRAANAMPEFRQRVRGDSVVEHEIVHPSITVMMENDLFTFCTLGYSERFSEFAVEAAAKMAYPPADTIVKLLGQPRMFR